MNKITIYTDGAVHKGTIGWGFAVFKKGHMIHSAFGCIRKPEELIKQRNVAGEVQAVIKALLWSNKNNFDDVLIRTDYIGCIKWANNEWNTNNRYTTRYKELVKALRTEMIIRFKFVKGHSGKPGNELADELAKKGARL